MKSTIQERKGYGEAFLLTFFSFLVFSGTYFAAYKILYYRLHLLAADLPLLKSGFDTMKGLDTIIKVKHVAPLVGFALGGLMAIFLLILLLVFSKWRRQSIFAGLFVALIALTPLGLLIFDVLILTSKNTALISGIQAYIGIPAAIGIVATIMLYLVWFGGRRLFSRKLSVVLFIPFLPFLSGCSIEALTSGGCEFSSDADHCYQMGAIQSGNPADCEKIKGKHFVGENPPKDKCYLSIAANTGNYEVCDKIEGGMMSYTKEECLKEVVIANKDRAKCEALNKSGQQLDCAAIIPKDGDNPLKEGETPVAKVFQVKGDVRIIKEDGRVIPITKDSVLGPNDRISALESSSFIIDFDGRKAHCVPQNTMLSMTDKYELDNACAAAVGIR